MSSQPWRPRLVQEGTPLVGNSNHDQSMHDANAEAPPPAPAAAARPLHHGHDDLHAHHAQRESSLTRAAGGTFHVRPPHISTKVVIGAGDDDGHARDDEQVIHRKDSEEMSCSPPRSSPARRKSSSPSRSRRKKASPLKMRLVVGGEDHEMHHDAQHDHTTVERMEGVHYQESKGPLVVMDGANIAYAYADSIAGFNHSGQPDARGIQVAAKYFLSAGVRVLVVIPATWFRAKPRAGDESHGNTLMLTPHLEVLNDLKSRGLLVAAPPRDDDDAYALTIARREDTRSRNRGGCGFVLSCDLFRDAIARDGQLRQWLTEGSGNGPGRISFAFCDMGSTDDYGDREMDLVPNPRHPLVSWIESEHRKNSS